MPKEVFAEDIERLIGALDGVVAVRVFTTRGGEIAQVYVTVDPAADVRAVRRGVGTALVSSYGIPIEPWRIQIAQPRTGPAAGALSPFRVLRVDEAVGAAEMTAVVQLAWTRGGGERVVSGRARGPVGSAHRLRTLAAATVDGAREALDPAYRKITAQDASLVTFSGRPTVLVGISVTTPRGDVCAFGIAQEDASSDAVVAATLDAVAKLSVQVAAVASLPDDRRAKLEAMRRYVESAERAPSPGDRAGPVASGGGSGRDGVPQAGLGAPPRAGESAAGGGPGAFHGAPERMYMRQARAFAERATSAQAAELPNGEDPDGSRVFQQIRPAQKGVTAMAVRQDLPHVGAVPSGPGRLSIEEVLYQSLIANRTPVHVRCRDGYELHPAVLRDVDADSVLLEVNGATELVYKHAILSIRPLTDPRAEA
ncbi:MAG TPA: RNA chaperone Hfq [bacterium]|nr:RNA chaperone Hfq [bacterium]